MVSLLMALPLSLLRREGLPSSTALKVIAKRDDGIQRSWVTRPFWKQIYNPMTSYSKRQKDSTILLKILLAFANSIFLALGLGVTTDHTS